MANTKEIFEQLSSRKSFSSLFKTQDDFEKFISDSSDDNIASFESLFDIKLDTEPVKKKGPLPAGYQRNTSGSGMYSNVAEEELPSPSPSVGAPSVTTPIRPMAPRRDEFGYTSPSDVAIEPLIPPAQIREQQVQTNKKVAEEVKRFKEQGNITGVRTDEEIKLPNLSEVIVSDEGGNTVFGDAALKFNATVLDITANLLDVPTFLWRYQNMLGLGSLTQEQIDRINSFPPEERDDRMFAELGVIGGDYAVSSFGELYAALNDIADMARTEAKNLRVRTNQYSKIIDGERVPTSIYQDIVDGNIGRAAKRTISEALGSSPYTLSAAATGGPTLLGVVSTVGKTEEELQRGEKVSTELLLASLATGAAETYYENKTQDIVRNFSKAAAGDQIIANSIAKNYVGAIAEATGTEATSEGLTELTQDIADSLFLGKEFSIAETMERVVDASLIGGVSGGGIATGGIAPVVYRKELKPYVSKLMLDSKQSSFIKDQQSQITQMTAEMEQAPDLKTKAAYQMAIDAANKTIQTTIDGGSSLVSKASPDQISEIAQLNIDAKKVLDAKRSIEESENIMPEAKAAAIAQLDASIAQINNRKDSMLKDIASSETFDEKFAPEVVKKAEESPIDLPSEMTAVDSGNKVSIETIPQLNQDAQSKIDGTAFDGAGRFAKELGGSKVDAVPVSYEESGDIATVSYVNPETGSVDVVVSAIKGNVGNNYAGFYRIYENGEPTNEWTSKFETKEKGVFQKIVSGAQKLLPKGHEYTEKESISTDGIRTWANQLKYGYKYKTDEAGNVVTRRVYVNNMAGKGEFTASTERSKITAPTQKVFDDVKGKVLPYLKQLGLDETNIHRDNVNRVQVDLPVLVESSAIESKTPEGMPEMTQPTGKETRPFAINIEDSKVITEAANTETDPFLKRTFRDVSRTFNVLKTLMPNLKIMLHETNAQYLANGNPENSIGNIKDNTININLEAARLTEQRQSDAMKHEGIHPIMQAVFDTNPDTINSLYDELLGLQEDLNVGTAAKNALNFGALYQKKGDKVVKMESLTEFVAFVASSNDRILEQDPTLLDRMKAFVEKIAKVLGINYRVKSTQDLKNLAKAISYTFLKGEDATDILDIATEPVVMDSMEEAKIVEDDSKALDNTIRTIYNGLKKKDADGNDVEMTNQEKFDELLNDPSNTGFKYTANQIARAVPALLDQVANYHKENAKQAIDANYQYWFDRRAEMAEMMYDDPFASPQDIYKKFKKDGYSDLEIFNLFTAEGIDEESTNDIFGGNYRQTIETLLANEEQSGYNPDLLYTLANDVRNIKIAQRASEAMKAFEGVPSLSVVSVLNSLTNELNDKGVYGATASAIGLIKKAYENAENSNTIEGARENFDDTFVAAASEVSQLMSISGRLLQLARGLKKDPNKMAEYVIKDIEGDTYQLTKLQKLIISKLLKSTMKAKGQLDALTDAMQEDISNFDDASIKKVENNYRNYKNNAKNLENFIGALKASQETGASWLKGVATKSLLSLRTVTVGVYSNLENFFIVKGMRPVAWVADMAISTLPYAKRTIYMSYSDMMSARSIANQRTKYELMSILTKGADTSYESVRAFASTRAISDGFRDMQMAQKIALNLTAKISGKKITDYDNLEEFANDFNILLVKLEDGKGLSLGTGKTYKQMSIMVKGLLGVVPEFVGRSIALSGDRWAYNSIKARAIADYSRYVGLTDEQQIKANIQKFMSTNADKFVGEEEAQTQIFINDNKIVKAIGTIRGGLDKQRERIANEEKRKYRSSWVSRNLNTNKATLAVINAIDLLVLYPLSPFTRVPSNVIISGFKKTYVPVSMASFVAESLRYVSKYNAYVKKYGAESKKELSPSELKKKEQMEKELFYAQRKVSQSVSELVFALILREVYRFLVEAAIATPPGTERDKERVYAGKEAEREPATIKVGDYSLSYPNLGIFGLGLSMYASDYQLSLIDKNRSASKWIADQVPGSFMALNAFGNAVENLSFIKGLGDFVRLFESQEDANKLSSYLSGPLKIYGSILFPNLFSFAERGEDFYAQNLREFKKEEEDMSFVFNNTLGLAAIKSWASLSGRMPINAMKSDYYMAAVGEYGEDLKSRNTVFEPGSVWAYLQTMIDPVRVRDYTIDEKNRTNTERANLLRDSKISDTFYPPLMTLANMNILSGGTGNFYKAIVTYFPNEFEYGVGETKTISLPFKDYVEIKKMIGKEKARLHEKQLDPIYTFINTLEQKRDEYKIEFPETFEEKFKEYVFEQTESFRDDLVKASAEAKRNVETSDEVVRMIENHLRMRVKEGEMKEKELEALTSMPGFGESIRAVEGEDPAFGPE